MTRYGKRRGLTLMELVLAISLAVILGGAFLVFSNPAGLFARARNSQRTSHINAIANAIKQNLADNRTGVFGALSGGGMCAAGNLPTSSKKMAVGAGNYDIAQCLIPIYIQNLPFDPSAAGAHYVSVADYDTGYTVMKNATSGEVTVAAPSAELSQIISVTR